MLLNMDESLIKEIHYLTRLIENHKKKSSDKLYVEEPIINQNLSFTKSEKYINLFHKSQQLPKTSNHSCNALTSTNVYINPNFKPQSSSIYINPKLHIKSLVHVNPKMMKSVINSNENVQNNIVNITSTNSIQKSVHVNPKLMKKLSSSVQSKPTEHKQIMIQNITHPVCSRLKFVKSTNSPKLNHNQKKINNSNIVVLSQRKLVRIRRGSRKSFSTPQIELCKIKKSSNSIIKNIKPTSQKIIKTKIINTLQQSIKKDTNFIKLPVMKPKINKYRIDRTVPKRTSTREQTTLSPKKIVNNKMELITIGGIVYKSSKNHLVRNSYGVKTTNGKKLCKVRSIKETLGNSSTKTINTTNGIKLSNSSQKINYRNTISNKVKQKSIQILRNKMQKNNQPCLIFQKFGYCSNHEKGICVKRHDKKQIFLCKKFLQGNCLLDKCPLSHDIGPEKMPTCKYFLEGCCTRDACPYRHIKVSSSTPICIDFLQGYCVKGSEYLLLQCKQRHENLCPEFEKTKKCSKGKHCPYPHKSQSSSKKQNQLKRKYNIHNNQATAPIIKDTSSSNNENRLRYYEQADSLNKSLDKKRESIMKKIKLMKNIKLISHSNTLVEISDNTNSETIIEDESETVSDSKVLKRPPIGVLPAYIPID
ncbi:zinc finger CCCH domain-containing protein 3 isoform X1 [Apis mellifera]|uniref:Zinc finger CCCH domain-containing protein 3 isoform X1 n=1 Tax=Apis mellifera TaxID=7460 RepID=A0A7M7SRM7_APIME|nr:zinc finger CCCH domain-containing protein 3 isoform X1 [Apis mellifera]|eukprot:XP_026300853.1 zinc finger CCCH domain-containing protein 3 isoform X1 [Apis mellifera]